MKARRFWALFVFALLLSAAAIPCYAFNAETRKEILKDSLEFMPPNLRDYLWAHWTEVNAGLLFDYRNNVQVDPRDIGNVSESLVARLKEGRLSEENTARGFGVMAALISEAVSPGYLSSSVDVDPPLVTYDGFQAVADPGKMVRDLIEAHKDTWGDSDRELLYGLYGITVNAVADAWVSAWKSGGQDTGQLVASGKEVKRSDSLIKELKLPGEEAAAGSAAVKKPKKKSGAVVKKAPKKHMKRVLKKKKSAKKKKALRKKRIVRRHHAKPARPAEAQPAPAQPAAAQPAAAQPKPVKPAPVQPKPAPPMPPPKPAQPAPAQPKPAK